MVCYSFPLAVFLLELLGLPFITTAQAPSGAPRDVAANAVSSRAIRVTWSDVPTEQRNGTLLQYQVQYTQSTFPEIPQSGTAEIAADLEDVLVLEDLEEYVEYMIQVRASNEDDYGPFSSPVYVTTHQDVPSSPPQNVHLTSQKPHELLLMWNRPPEIDINGVLLSYSLRYHRIGLEEDYVLDTISSSSERMVLSGLYSYTTYEVFLGALTVNGTGPFARQSGQTIETAPEEPPQNFTANSSTPYTIEMEWMAPDEAKWNGILRGYQLRYAKTGDSPPEWLEIQISPANETTFALLGLLPSTVYCIQIAAVTVEPGPYTSPLYIETLQGTTSGPDTNTNGTVDGSGDLENGSLPVNVTTTSGGGESVAIIAGSVVAGVVSLTLVGVAFSLGAVAILRQRRLKKSFSLAEYFTTASSEDPHQQHSQRDDPQQEPTDISFTNPTALSFELQSNPRYNQPLFSLPPPPYSTGEPITSDGETSPSAGHTNEGQTLPLSVMIADNPRYRQFSSNQPQTNGTGGVVRANWGVVSVEVSEGEYDYPATFRPHQATDNNPYSRPRVTSDDDQVEDPPYATVT